MHNLPIGLEGAWLFSSYYVSACLVLCEIDEVRTKLFLENLEVVGNVLVALGSLIELRLGRAFEDALLLPFADPLHDGLPLRSFAVQHRGEAPIPRQQIFLGSVELRGGLSYPFGIEA